MPNLRNDALMRRKGCPPDDDKASSLNSQTTVNDGGFPRSSQQSDGTISRKAERPGVDGERHNGLADMASAAAQATLPAWINTVMMVSLIFGGCCANVCDVLRYTYINGVTNDC